MKLYLSPGACSMAIHILLEEIGHPYHAEVVSVAHGETGRPAFLARNPKGRVPVLELEDGTVITELIAIIAYLHLRFPGHGLLPDTPLGAARAWEWLSWLGSDVHARSFGAIWRPGRFSADVDAHSSITSAGRGSALEQYARIDSMLVPSGAWALGQTRTCVDAVLLVYYQWGVWIGFDMATRFPAWTAHTRQMLRQPAVVRVLEREGLAQSLAEAAHQGAVQPARPGVPAPR